MSENKNVNVEELRVTDAIVTKLVTEYGSVDRSEVKAARLIYTLITDHGMTLKAVAHRIGLKLARKNHKGESAEVIDQLAASYAPSTSRMDQIVKGYSLALDHEVGEDSDSVIIAIKFTSRSGHGELVSSIAGSTPAEFTTSVREALRTLATAKAAKAADAAPDVNEGAGQQVGIESVPAVIGLDEVIATLTAAALRKWTPEEADAIRVAVDALEETLPVRTDLFA